MKITVTLHGVAAECFSKFAGIYPEAAVVELGTAVEKHFGIRTLEFEKKWRFCTAKGPGLHETRIYRGEGESTERFIERCRICAEAEGARLVQLKREE